MPCGVRIGRRGRFESFKARKMVGKEDERGKASQGVVCTTNKGNVFGFDGISQYQSPKGDG